MDEKQLIVIFDQLNEWINDCELQANVFFEKGMTVSEKSSLAMKVAYMNVKTLIENSISLNETTMP